MQTRSWDDQATGTKKYRTEVIADRVQFGTNSSNRTEASSAPKANASEDDKEELETIEYPDEQINVEDIPF